MISRIIGFFMSIIMFICSLLGIGSVDPGQGGLIHQDDKSSFSIALEQNASTGYRWTCKIDDDSIVKVADDNNVIHQDGGFVGVPSARVFTFSAVKEGKTTVTLSYERSWEKEPIRVVIMEIEVLPDMTITQTIISDISK